MSVLRRILSLLWLLASVMRPDVAYAGFAAGPFLVWVNLQKDANAHITEEVVRYVKNEKIGVLCDRNVNGPILYVNSRPEGLTDQLVTDALIKHDNAAIASLREKLLTFRDPPDVTEGLDGLIVYAEIDGPRMIGFGAKSGRPHVSAINRTMNSYQVIKSFCAVVPPIWRK